MKNNGLRTAIQVATVLGFMASGLVWMETRYAKAAEVSSQFADVQVLILENRLHDLAREQWNLSGCTSMECQDRKVQVTTDIEQTKQKLDILRRRQSK